jgi:tRNA U34 5-carboxymethylaminomethyl modifying GTPase MnmE/TrmE
VSTGGKPWEDALKENREVHTTAKANKVLFLDNKLKRMQDLEKTRMKLKAERDSICLSFSAMSAEELQILRAELSRKVKLRPTYFGGTFKSRADIA